MAGNLYQNGLWTGASGEPELVNEQAIEPGQLPDAGATRQFVAGQLGKKINLHATPGSLLVKEWQYVLRDDTTEWVGPIVVCWNDPTDGLYGVQIATDGLVPAGVFHGDDTAAVGLRGMQDGNFGYIQIGGHVQLTCGGVVSAGSDVTFVDGDGTVVDRTLFSEPLVAVALEDGTTGDSAWCLLSLVTVD